MMQNFPVRRILGMVLAIGIGSICWISLIPAAEAVPETIEFNRDIRPILSDTCFQCHGPDKANRKARLRLDTKEGAFADRGDHQLIVPGKPEKSELYLRLKAEARKRMPPVKTDRHLTPRQIDLFRQWIAQGARWEKHWSFIPPRRRELPKVKNATWTRNAIDHFVLARLERAGLAPSPEADRTTLIRRVTLDLTGLPPTPAEVDAFLKDTSPNAYEKMVDRLLASPRYGERMAIRWLDHARYADTNGYQSDGPRTMWRWRDWVIDAFNRNMPFDQFTIEQIAGDMLPNPTLDQRIATGFNRNHRGNAEGGIIPEEYAVEYVVDRVDTTATVWLGLTMLCSRCHDHKYDPIEQKEFYQVFAYFNNVPEKGKAVKFGNSPPFIKAPTRKQQQELQELETKLEEARKQFAAMQPRLARRQRKWAKALGEEPIDWTVTDGLQSQFNLDGNIKVTRPVPSGGRKPPEPELESVPEPKLIGKDLKFTDGTINQCLSLTGHSYIDAGNTGNFGFYDKFTLAAWIFPQGNGTILSRMKDVDRADGYYVRYLNGKVQINLVKRWLDDSLRVESAESLPHDQWHHILVTYDGSRVAAGLKLYINGKQARLNILLDELNQTFRSKEPFRIGAGGGPKSRFHGKIDDVRIYADALKAEQAAIVATAANVNAIAKLKKGKRTPGQALKIREYYLEKVAPRRMRMAHLQVVALQKEREKLVDRFPTTMVMVEMPKPRETHVLVRGEYDKLSDKVLPGIPSFLPPLPRGAPNNRLGFARWLVDPANPLTARVTVNRYWQTYFGSGLVKTVDDFGSQGAWPTHPDLLDWLATEFIRTGWDVKAMQKRIVMSAAYRQSSRVTKQLLQADPENKLLARGPRIRLSAETIRDQALAVSGLLVNRIGGPSVKPYQPEGLWRDVAELFGGDYVVDDAPNVYRRSLYTYWKRTVAPPGMMTFDAANRETCVVRQTRTNTPLQALNLMNDVTYVEAGRVLAQRIMTEGGTTPEERLSLAFRLATARKPKPLELKILVNGYRYHLDRFRKDPKAALKLVETGKYSRNKKLDIHELAAFATMAGVILNLDETITKE